MVKLTFVQPDGARQEVDVASGLTVMEAARDAGIRGISAECGGACACSTCHVYVAPEWVGHLPSKRPHEEDMLEFAWEPDPARSRLTCQIVVAPEIDGLSLHVPARQG